MPDNIFDTVKVQRLCTMVDTDVTGQLKVQGLSQMVDLNVTGQLTVHGRSNLLDQLSLNEHMIQLRKADDTPLHGLGYYGITGRDANIFADTDIDGPVLFGYNGGALGSTGNDPKIALRWDNDNNIKVAGDIFLTNADCAEEFEVASGADCEPGTVLSINDDEILAPCTVSYDKRVAGVVSGASGVNSGIILGKKFDILTTERSRVPIALTGKVCCLIDASYCPVEVGDLLTTSSTLGHAMKVDDPARAFGAVIGKALRPLHKGTGIIPVLVALQ